MAGWPAVDATAYEPFDKPVLWVAGSESTYVRSDDAPAMRAMFPKVRQVVVKGAAHWVHSDQPDVTIQILDRFLRR